MLIAFREYLVRSKTFRKMMLVVMEQGDAESESLACNRALVAQLEDIIHHFDEFVKTERKKPDVECCK